MRSSANPQPTIKGEFSSAARADDAALAQCVGRAVRATEAKAGSCCLHTRVRFQRRR